MPWFILIAGPNGAGKTTLTGSREFLEALDLFPKAVEDFPDLGRPSMLKPG